MPCLRCVAPNLVQPTHVGRSLGRSRVSDIPRLAHRRRQFPVLSVGIEEFAEHILEFGQRFDAKTLASVRGLSR